jgi:AraC-like DNA-binding protein
LDRNPGFNSAQLSSYRVRKKVILDGNLADWEIKNGISFKNNDNTCTLYSHWDDTHLYFAAVVKDKSIISTFSPRSEKIDGMSLEDVIEIFLDTDHDHSEICVLPDRHFLLSPGGKAYETFIRRDLQYTERTNVFPKVGLAVTIDGTLNTEADIDAGYTIETSISWKELGITPRKGRTIGLEVWNTDRDYLQGTGTFAGWTTNATNLKNPSEWGNLVLVEEKSLPRLAFVLLPVFLLSGSAALLFFHKKRKLVYADSGEEALPAEKPEEIACIRKAKEFTLAHFFNETLDRETVAAQVGLHPTYFGKVFKMETGVHYAEYLTEIRIEKAKELLRTTQKNVTEIAYETGFSSQSYFSTVFKKKTGLTPKQYMNQTH